MINWNEFTQLVKQAHHAQADKALPEIDRQFAATFAALGLAILDVMARLEASSNKSVLVSTTGEHIERSV